VHGDLINFIYETTPLVPKGGEHILHSGVIDYISVRCHTLKTHIQCTIWHKRIVTSRCSFESLNHFFGIFIKIYAKTD